MSESPRAVVSFQDRLAQFQMARELVQTARVKYQMWKDRQTAESRFYVTVEDDDQLFSHLQKWLMRDLKPELQRSVVVETQRNYDERDGRHTYSITTSVEDDYESEVLIEDRWITVEITSSTVADKGGYGDPLEDALDAIAPSMRKMMAMGSMKSSFVQERRVIFTCNSKDERDSVVRHLEDMAVEMSKHKRVPSFYTAQSYGDWTRTNTVMRRPIDAVILAGDGRERIVEDLQNFMKTEERYISLGFPWHHGYLLEGPPGTGKTSLAAALAATFSLDVYYIPLSIMESDAKLMECINHLNSQKAILVLEDVDIVSATRERDDARKGITLQGLLNALDGIATPHGLITLMTTNDVSVLDPALIRPGRVDFKLHVGYVTDDQFVRLCERFIGRKVDVPRIFGNITPAEIVGIFKDGDNDQVDGKLVDLVLEANIAAHEKSFSVEGVQTSQS